MCVCMCVFKRKRLTQEGFPSPIGHVVPPDELNLEGLDLVVNLLDSYFACSHITALHVPTPNRINIVSTNLK